MSTEKRGSAFIPIGKKPREGILRITRRGVKTENEPTFEQQVDLADIDTVHPFDKPDFIEWIDSEFFGYGELAASSQKPRLSNNPDQLETWEAAQVLKRKRLFGDQSNMHYLMRLLYEEAFSVDQNPGMQVNVPVFQGSFGLVPGGLISHYMDRQTFDLEKALSLFQASANTREAVKAIPRLPLDQEQVLHTIIRCSQRVDAEQLAMLELTSPERVRHLCHRLLNTDHPYEELYDVRGHRLLAMLHATPEMTAPLQDESILVDYPTTPANMPSRAYILQRYWSYFSRTLMAEHYFREPDDDGVRDAIEELLRFRTHPEMQIFFKYLSPSGYLNER